MKNLFRARAPSFDAQAIDETIRRALASAGLDTASGPMHDVTETIRRALASAALHRAAAPSDPGGSTIDTVARVVDVDERRDGERPITPPPDRPDAPGSFEAHVFSNDAGTRAYKLYVPSTPAEAPRPLLVMLHGCTQSADDFAAGTQMNRLAEAHDFLVLYPEQGTQANPSRCWNWFNPQDQLREGGEPSLIAGIVGEVAAQHGVDPRRIFVAGLSAGAAMAVVLGETHPELFAGVGVHSGLPYGSAHDVPSAMAAMKGGRSGWLARQGVQVAPAGAPKQAARAVPTIVFHGDRDHIVQQTNGAEIVRQARDAHLAQTGADALRVTTSDGQASGGRAYRRTVHEDGTGTVHLECWTLHGAGHAWSGGDARGSYTDATGPDASAEMVRFFLSLPRAGSA